LIVIIKYFAFSALEEHLACKKPPFLRHRFICA